jgi:putative membrane protein insertion efficiency factor
VLEYVKRSLTGIPLLLIRGYQLLVSPLLGPHCRFHPSCSEYCHQALARHGVRRGGWLGLARIVRCHPWNVGGVDQVPED